MCASHQSGTRLRFALCALRLSVLSAFNNIGRQCDLKLVFGYIILVDVVGV